jgi:hypothetical protein
MHTLVYPVVCAIKHTLEVTIQYTLRPTFRRAFGRAFQGAFAISNSAGSGDCKEEGQSAAGSLLTTTDGAGVPTIQYPFYLNFGREIWALTRKEVSGESLALEAATLIAKWKARGLTEALLQAIRTDVFNVAAPIGP